MLCFLVVLTIVVPKSTGHFSDLFHFFHISHNGSDTSDCGGSVDSACFSLLHVLMLYYAEPPNMGLGIKTDKSLVINSNLMVIKKWKR